MDIIELERWKPSEAGPRKLLLDGSMDFNSYRQWAKNRPCPGHEETLQTLADHWTELQATMEQAPVQETGGMIFG